MRGRKGELVRDLIYKETALKSVSWDTEAYNAINMIPTIEAVEVKHGRWLRGSSYPHHIFCSVCYATYIPNDEIPLWKSESYFNVPRNYCPYCGAKMDGGGDNEIY